MTETNSTLEFSAVPPIALDIVWPAASELLAPAVEVSKGRYSLHEMWRELNECLLGLWVVLDGSEPVAAITTRVVDYPECRALAMDWIGGSRMEEWLPMAQARLGEYALDQGCTQLEGYGRKGWERSLRKLGWSPDLTIYRMDLTHG